ncbi:ethanolamine utilization protein EutJ [Eubacterium oxidoreducens]|uniref:Ethanolamine utilization protein EutJ n=1 Tax=Eubacterium oxidoreducens TaxID=1732 RepID=A0A1G6BRM0_EUBOX|nr:ethanolamine utilization protein EutJ [Eubacterium oxidoreducens]SDB23215.1 ethanolamine utilization protein EutJ [Eubacterium oxidoreducens]
MIIEKGVLDSFATLVETETVNSYDGPLKVGVDLGTANIVLAVVDENNEPVAGAMFPSTVVKDGIVVDYMGAIQIVKGLKEQVEQRLGTVLEEAACAIPPGVVSGSVKAISNVVEGAGFDVINIVDEPTAAASVLDIKDGAVVDVGGGTTGISIIKDGEVIYTADEPTGGTHMTLVLAGYYNLAMEEAEALKKNSGKEADIFPIVKPVIQKMATIVKNFLKDYEVPAVYVVGGACSFKEFAAVFEKELGIPTIKSNQPLLVTPLGIAMNSVKQ